VASKCCTYIEIVSIFYWPIFVLMTNFISVTNKVVAIL
jgi:hypothetical protein